VAIRGDESGWSALEQALEIAHREGARLQGLHVVPVEEQVEHPDAQAIQTAFARRCDEMGVEGHLVFEVGPVHRKLCERARWSDLLVASLNFPPQRSPISKISSHIGTLIRRCPSPLLVVPGEPSSFHGALLAYDGTPKAREALFVATYMAGRWGVPLTVLSVAEGDHVNGETLAEARDYVEAHGVEAVYEEGEREDEETVADTILRRAADRESDLILMGGYGVGPVLEAVLGTTLDHVLRRSPWPTLICR
jgi:nucleotide-binding universal stress UspA family protein